MSPLVSVIIPTYNRARFLPTALASVASQEYRPIEVIVIDDGSKDNTPEVIAEQKKLLAEKGIELNYIRQPNAGPARARNTGLAQLKGDFVCFLDSDDIWKPKIVSTLKRLFDEYPSAGLTFSAYVCIDADDKVIGQRPTRLPPEPREGLLVKPFYTLINHMPTNTTCVMARRSVLEEMNFFDTALYIGEDWDLWYRIAKKYDMAYTLDSSMAFCRDHPQNMPKHNARGIADRLRLIIKHLPDVHEPNLRAELIRRARENLVLLQEQLMRERLDQRPYMDLLEHKLAPKSIRYRMGAFVRKRSSPVQKTYTWLVRTLGRLQRFPASRLR
jgi:glycosyltransferase involved in cell wall biosynthesis